MPIQYDANEDAYIFADLGEECHTTIEGECKSFYVLRDPNTVDAVAGDGRIHRLNDTGFKLTAMRSDVEDLPEYATITIKEPREDVEYRVNSLADHPENVNWMVLTVVKTS